ncbi:MAG: glutathione S-transferase family protein [Nannocystaceae bacterium]|nr:glutathione S-transferase family protein [bacterium]
MTMPSYTLYHSPLSQHSRRVQALLEEASIDYQVHPIALEKGGHMDPSYLAINPNHQLPTLVVDDEPLTESNAILRYLCNAHELSQWYPTRALARARVDQWLDWNQCRLADPVTQLVINVAILGDKGDPKAIESARTRLPPILGVLEQHLDGRSFVASDEQPTIADLSIASNITQLGFAQATPTDPNITRWYETIASRPGFVASMPPAPR